MKYLIIGGGIAGTTAAESLRANTPDAQITILSNEPHPLYSRVLLPHYIQNKVPRTRVFLKKPDWYTNKSITLLFETVTALNPKTKTVTTDKSTHKYNKLIIAGGGQVQKLPFESSHCHHFQTIEDADRIKTMLENLKPTDTAAIVGGGLIAMEFCQLFTKQNIKTHFFLRSDRFFSKNIDLPQSKIIETNLKKHNIEIHKTTSINSINNQQIKTKSGEIYDISITGIGTGLSSKFEWAENAGIKINSGILTNEFLETNIKDIYSIGDCTEYYNTTLQKHMHIGNYMNAQMQGRHIAKILTTNREPYKVITSSAFKILGIDIIIIGDADITNTENIITREDKDGRTLIFTKNGLPVGASLINRNQDRAELTQAIKNQTPITK